MPRVPGATYEPYFTGQAPEGGIPLREPNVPADAFGMGIARATQLFGDDVQKGSNEVYSRALALRQLEVDRQVRDSVTSLVNQQAPVQEKFLTQEGNNAGPSAMEAHLADLNQMHATARAQLEKQGIGPYGIDRFDNEYASIQRSFTREAVIHSARQVRVAQDASMDASVNTRLDLIGSTPNSEEFDKFLKDIPSIVRSKQQFKGEGEDWAARLTGVLTSKAIVSRADALAREGNYEDARAFINAHKDQVLGENDRSRTEAAVNNSENRYLGHNIARATAQGFAPYMTPREIDRSMGVSTPLLEVFKRAQANHPEIEMTIGDSGGRRSALEQARLVLQGRSKTMQSGHLDGTAVDIVGRENGRPAYENKDLQEKVDDAMREAASELDVDLRPQLSWDKYHFQLVKGYNVDGFAKPPPASWESQVATGTEYANKVSPNNPGLPDAIAQHSSYNRAVEAEGRRAENAAVQKDANQIFSKNVTTDTTGNLVVNPALMQQALQLLSNHPNAEHARTTAESLIHFFEAQTKQAAQPRHIVNDPNVADDLTSRLLDPAKPLTLMDVLNAETNGIMGRPGISTQLGAVLRQSITARDQAPIKDPLFKIAMDSAKVMIEGTSAIDRSMNAGTFAAFQFQFMQEYMKRSREGKLLPEDLNMGNPDSLIRKMTEQYVPGIGQTIRNNGGVNPSAVPPPPPAVTAPPPAPPPPATVPATAPPAAPKPPPTISSKKEYDALKPGASFFWGGKPYTKPEKGKAPEPQASM